MRRPFPPYVAREFRESRQTAETLEKQHGRVEHRRLTTSTVLNEYLNWPGVAQVCQITRRVQAKGQTTTEVAYAVTSVPRALAEAKTILRWWRGHWGIENRLHWVRDATFGEDASKIRTGAAPQALAAIRNACIALLRAENVAKIAETLREHAVRAQSLFARLGRWSK